MNTLSWLLYLADTLPNLGDFLSFMAFVTGVATIVIFFVVALCDDQEVTKNWVKMRISTQKWAFFVFTLSSFFSIVIPSKETFYLIAASEGAEVVVTSEAAQEMLTDVQTVIKLQLKQSIANLQPNPAQ